MKNLTHIAVLAATLLATPLAAQETSLRDQTITTQDQTFRYLSAGSDGPAIVLVHGWPQNADAFRHVMPLLAEDYVVYAPDLTGIGGTDAPDQDWSKEALGGDLHAFVTALDLQGPIVVGHDIGGMVAYSYARQFPEELSGLIVADVPIPGIAPWDWVLTISNSWHFDFHAQVGLAEDLVMGQQEDYLRHFIDQTAKNGSAISDEDITVFANAYGSRDQLSAGFEFYRSFEEDAAFFDALSGPFDVPTLVIGAETSMAGALDMMAVDLEASGVLNLETAVLNDSGHWIFEEQPEATVEVIAGFVERAAGQ